MTGGAREPRLCPDCGTDISARHPNAKRCRPCAHGRRKSQCNRACRNRYAKDPEFRASRAAYNREYRQRPGKREHINQLHRNWRSSPRGQATRRAYNQRPEVRERNAERMRGQYSPRPPGPPPEIPANGTPLSPECVGRTVPRRAMRPRAEYAADRKAGYAAAMEAAAEPRRRECADCGREAPPSALERNGGLCGFCAEFERRGRAA